MSSSVKKKTRSSALYRRVREILESARASVTRTVKTASALGSRVGGGIVAGVEKHRPDNRRRLAQGEKRNQTMNPARGKVNVGLGEPYQS
jgi:hypothetical protein